MKKLVALMFVLGVTALASATLTLAGDGTSTGSIIGADNTSDIGILMITTGGTVDGGTITYTGGAATIKDTAYYEDHFGSEFGGFLSMIETFNSLALGSINQLFSLECAGAPNGTLAEFDAVNAPVTLQLIDADMLTAVGDSVTLVVPEPATLAMLGLGGLLLKKHK